MHTALRIALAGLALAAAAPAFAGESATLVRIDAANVELDARAVRPVSVWISSDTRIDDSDTRAALPDTAGRLELAIPASERRYVILRDADGHDTVVTERSVALQQGSNFRDVGGYATRDGRTVRWGKAFRSGAMPMLTEADYALVRQLAVDSVVDLRSLDEREVAPDMIDDRTGALFISNDYSMKPLMAKISEGDGENAYRGIEKTLAPQYRSLFRRLIADEGAVVYHCSAGQDRTGIATALLYDTLGVDRETILKDYHLSTALRRPEWEMPRIDPKDYPNNLIVQYYFARSREADARSEPVRAEPLYTPTGISHLAQFFTYVDQEYGGSEGYLRRELGFADQDIARLRQVMLD